MSRITNGGLKRSGTYGNNGRQRVNISVQIMFCSRLHRV